VISLKPPREWGPDRGIIMGAAARTGPHIAGLAVAYLFLICRHTITVSRRTLDSVVGSMRTAEDMATFPSPSKKKTG